MANSVIDFTRSHLAWTTTAGSNGHWRLIAAASLLSIAGVRIEQFALAPRVIAGDVYGSGPLLREPSYSFQIFASSQQHTILREAAAPTACDVVDTTAANETNFAKLDIDIAAVDGIPVALETLSAERVTAVWPLTAILEVGCPDGKRWLLEFPIDHINTAIIKGKAAFQVETGPILVPQSLISTPSASINGGFALAYAFFNRSDRVDLAVWGPHGSEKLGGRDFCHFDRLEQVAIKLFARVEQLTLT